MQPAADSEGPRAVFLALLESRRLAWYGLVRRQLRDPAAAEDALQEGLLLAWRHVDEVRDPATMEAWVRQVLVRFARRQTRQSADLPCTENRVNATAVEDRVLQRWSLAQAVAMIEALPPRQRAAVLRRCAHDEPYAAIASALACTEATARSLVRFGLSRVRPALRQLAV
jgi:RNA polymerase sigma-70 factor (ECF subfamily)